MTVTEGEIQEIEARLRRFLDAAECGMTLLRAACETFEDLRSEVDDCGDVTADVQRLIEIVRNVGKESAECRSGEPK